MSKAKPITYLKGKRVVLRIVLEEDYKLFIKWINDPKIRKNIITRIPVMEKGEKKWIENLDGNQNKVTLVILVKDRPVGVIGLDSINWQDRTATTGTVIGEEKFRGHGYGTEAKMILLNYAFNELNLRKISSSAIEFNKRSYNYSKRCGYKKEGKRKKQFFKNGKYWDEIILAVFKKDWLPLWKKFKKNYSF